MERFDPKRIYGYLVCLIALFVLLWGTIDLAGVSISLIAYRSPSLTSEQLRGVPPAETKGLETAIEEYYQRRMVYERLGDSLARIIIPGLVFVCFSRKLKKLEGGAA